MKFAVIGSRDFTNYDKLKSVLSQYEIGEIVSGGARGADSMAARYAREHNIKLTEFIPDWSIGKHAGHVRNQLIIDSADVIIAFWDNHSPGTKDSIRKAKKAGKHCIIVDVRQGGLNFG